MYSLSLGWFAAAADMALFLHRPSTVADNSWPTFLLSFNLPYFKSQNDNCLLPRMPPIMGISSTHIKAAVKE
jgi:hypothetical protein